MRRDKQQIFFEIVHLNVCGLMKNKSMGGATYFVDDFSRKV